MLRAIVLRPLAVFTFTFYITSCILFTADSDKRFWSAVIFSFLFALCLALCLTLPAFRKRDLRRASAVCLCFFLCSASLAGLLSFAESKRIEKYESLCERSITVEGTVTEVEWSAPYGGEYIVKVDSIYGYAPFLCIIDGPGKLSLNDRVAGEVTFFPLATTEEFDERRYYLSRKVVLSGEADVLEAIGTAPPSAEYAAKRANTYLTDTFTRFLGEERGGFAASLLLGNDSHLEPTVNRDFKRLGLSHVLAISGMHLTVICAFLSFIFKPLGKRKIQLICAATVVFYMFITGLSPAIMRSGAMLLFYTLASSLGRGGDRYTNLGLSLFLITLIDNGATGDVGLQLSFAAVLAIFLNTEKRLSLSADVVDLKAQKKILGAVKAPIKGIFESIILTTLIILFMMPLEWRYFGSICLIAPLITPLFSVISTILLWMLPLILLASPIKSLASLIALLAGELIDLCTSLANRFSLLRNISLPVNIPYGNLLSFAVFFSVLLFFITRKKARLALAAATLICTASLIISSFTAAGAYDSAPAAAMLCHKSSDGLLLLSDRKAFIVDIGNGYKGIIEKGLSDLDTAYLCETEAIVLTHLHNAYPQTLERIFSRNIVRKLYLPYSDSPLFESIENLCEKHKVELIPYVAGEEIELCDITLSTYGDLYIKRSTQPSIRLDVEASDYTLTYLGGAYLETYPKADLSGADSIWFGNHGPLYKEDFSPVLSDDCRVFAGENAKEHLIIEKNVLPPDIIILSDPIPPCN